MGKRLEKRGNGKMKRGEEGKWRVGGEAIGNVRRGKGRSGKEVGGKGNKGKSQVWRS